MFFFFLLILATHGFPDIDLVCKKEAYEMAKCAHIYQFPDLKKISELGNDNRNATYNLQQIRECYDNAKCSKSQLHRNIIENRIEMYTKAFEIRHCIQMIRNFDQIVAFCRHEPDIETKIECVVKKIRKTGVCFNEEIIILNEIFGLINMGEVLLNQYNLMI